MNWCEIWTKLSWPNRGTTCLEGLRKTSKNQALSIGEWSSGYRHFLLLLLSLTFASLRDTKCNIVMFWLAVNWGGGESSKWRRDVFPARYELNVQILRWMSYLRGNAVIVPEFRAATACFSCNLPHLNSSKLKPCTEKGSKLSFQIMKFDINPANQNPAAPVSSHFTGGEAWKPSNKRMLFLSLSIWGVREIQRKAPPNSTVLSTPSFGKSVDFWKCICCTRSISWIFHGRTGTF